MRPAYFNVGGLYRSQSRPEAAETSFRAALRVDPRLAEAEVALAALLEARGMPQEAEAALRRALGLRPDYAGAAFNLSQLLYRQDRCDESEALLVGLDRDAFSPGEVVGALGEVYLKMGRHVDAHRAFSTMLRENPTEMDARSGLLFL